MRSTSAVLDYATGVLGPIEYTTDLTRRAGRVVAVLDRAGEPWIIKTVPTQAEFRCELNAYTRWVPHFVDQAPRLRHADPKLHTVILQRLPGHTDWTFEPRDHLEAGRLLRRIHEAAPARRSGGGVGELTADKLAVALQRLPDPGMLPADHLEYARACVVTLREEFDHLPRVPCHGDYGGHNWLRDADRLWVIDFASAAFNAAASDFARLFIGPWWERPDLIEAFFEGYGRLITDEELECVRLQLPTLAICLIGYGRRHGDREIERRGSYRIHKLMAGQDFTKRPSGLRRPYHAARGLAKAVWASRGVDGGAL